MGHLTTFLQLIARALCYVCNISLKNQIELSSPPAHHSVFSSISLYPYYTSKNGCFHRESALFFNAIHWCAYVPNNLQNYPYVLTTFLQLDFPGAQDLSSWFRHLLTSFTSNFVNFLPSKMAFGGLASTTHGGTLSTSTTDQILKAKREIQKLREEYLRAGDEAEQKKLAERIAWHKRLISELGGR